MIRMNYLKFSHDPCPKTKERSDFVRFGTIVVGISALFTRKHIIPNEQMSTKLSYYFSLSSIFLCKNCSNLVTNIFIISCFPHNLLAFRSNLLLNPTVDSQN